VLLAEDDAVNRKVGQRLLRSINCDVTVVCNGQEALDVLRQVPAEQEVATSDNELPPQFDLVLMDLQMPVMDGTHAVIVCSLSVNALILAQLISNILLVLEK
jgi:CheY-like chemotaxis protein